MEHTNFMMMIGVVASGKSTLAQKLKNMLTKMGQPTMIVSSDEIRETVFGDVNDQTHNDEVFKEVRRRINNCIDKVNVIVDATNINVKSRKSLLDIVRNKENVNKVAYVMTTPVAVCKRQNKARTRTVSEEVIDRQIGKFEIPFYEEGFDTINLIGWNFNQFEVIVPLSNWTTDDDYIMSLMKGFDQKTCHHKYTLDEHCRICAEEVAKRTDDKILYRAAQIHDLGKLTTGQPKEDGSGDYRYYSHHNVGTYDLLANLDCIGFTNMDDILKCLFYVNFHMLPFFLETEKSKAKWEKIMGKENLDKLFLFNECDKIASGTSEK